MKVNPREIAQKMLSSLPENPVIDKVSHETHDAAAGCAPVMPSFMCDFDCQI